MTPTLFDFNVLEDFYDKLFGAARFVYETYFASFIGPLLPAISIISKILSVIFIVGIITVLMRLRKLNMQEREKNCPIAVAQEEERANNVRWQVIWNHAASANPAEWKIAIIEADNILDELLQDAGYAGETMADRLKAAGASETVQQAWEAHKVRNRIAHESGLELSRREVDITIALYESVFKRMGFL